MEDTDQIATGTLPDKDIAVVTSRCNIVVSVTKEDGLFDVGMCVAMAAEAIGVVIDMVIALIWYIRTLVTCVAMVAGASIMSWCVCVCVCVCGKMKRSMWTMCTWNIYLHVQETRTTLLGRYSQRTLTLIKVQDHTYHLYGKFFIFPAGNVADC